MYKTIKDSNPVVWAIPESMIYGELTKPSFRRLVKLMIVHTQFSMHSLFIDIGSGAGKPVLHVAQFPGVQFSCGIEMEWNRYVNSIVVLEKVFSYARGTVPIPKGTCSPSDIRHNCIFIHGDITKQVTTFDPFTHVYIFSVG